MIRVITAATTRSHRLLPKVNFNWRVMHRSRAKVRVQLYRSFDWSERIQIQERLTRQIADAIQRYLHVRGTAVIIRAHHLCMGCRGVKLPGTELVTSAMLGTLRDDAVTRAEFLRLSGGN